MPSAGAGMVLPELLAPAGDWACAKAAIENGTDAIYFGLDKFNARMRADNFTIADLPRLMAFLHRRGVKGYVTLNTLVFEPELAEAEAHLRAIIAAGADAVIVQDVGIARLVRRLSPDFPIHASTQMTISSAAGIAFARELGCQRVVLARECSLAEIEKIREADRRSSPLPSAAAAGDSPDVPGGPASAPAPMPLEVFVHGALCVAYSGQCLTSEALGGRSANRGECAQACRLPYELIADGQPVPLGDRRYLLSPQDLVSVDLLPELVRVGVASLKIEGRLKSPEYVANVTRIYRQALDQLAAAAPPPAVSPAARYALEMAFSRGLYSGWMRGVNHQALVHGRFGKKRGVFLGEVTRVLRDAVVVRLAGPLKPGDGVVFDAGNPEAGEEGGRVYEIRKWTGDGPGHSELRFGRGDLDFRRLHAGDKLWKTDDPELNRRLRQSFAGDTVRFPRPIHLEIHGAVGQPLTLIARDEAGHVAQVTSARPLVRAEKQPLTRERLREQLGRLGGTPFKLGGLKNALPDDVLLPVSELNQVRRRAVAELERQRAQPQRWQLTDAPSLSSDMETSSAATLGYQNLTGEAALASDDPATAAPGSAELIVLVRNLAQLEAALRCGVTTVYCDFENPKKYREAVTLFHTARGCAAASAASPDPQPSIWVAPPRIGKPGEDWILHQVRSSNADGYLVRNYDHLRFFAGDRRRGDYTLNIANRLAADYFKTRWGLERLTASYDLNFEQLAALVRGAPPAWFEVTIHQHMPMFHMEHCVFCAFLSTGKDYRDCGRPCDTRTVQLRDRVGAAHPVKADAGCRNTVFHARAQTGAEYVARLRALGVRHFRVEFLDDSPAHVTRTISKYRQLLRGEISGAQLWRELRLFNQLGVTRGPLRTT